VITLLVTASVVPSSPILVTLMMETKRSSETTVPTTPARRNFPEDILHIHRHEIIKPHILVAFYLILHIKKHACSLFMLAITSVMSLIATS
jgi:hypothetical protein